MRADCHTLLRGAAPATRTCAQTLSAGDGVSWKLDGSEKLVSVPIHTSPESSVVSQASLLGNVPTGTDHSLASPQHQIDADDMLEDDDMTGVTVHKLLGTQISRKKGGSSKPLVHECKEKKPRHKSRNPRGDVVVPESPQSQHAHSLAIAQQVIGQYKSALHGTPQHRTNALHRRVFSPL
ncbi:hypothetical protein PR048_001861 [Dryococelus australis]|uniref:Uncharacterized protein n=1 Tax=Dryococelus australis TaxID=614101 RepID=A0ABQ9IIN0_9NEOP|nr:hypothetical protein PR048_001861 [Dryococelus australis]